MDFPDAIFRANPHLQILTLDRLPDAARAIKESDLQGDVYGVLVSRLDSSTSDVKVIDCNTALLLFSLSEPSKLPHHVYSSWNRRVSSDFVRLLFEGIVE